VAASVAVPVLHIVDAVAAVAPDGPPGLLATRATLQARLFPDRLGRRCIEPTEAELREVVIPAIAAVKRGDAVAWAAPLRAVVERMLSDGASAVVLACTELPLALDDRSGCIDTTEALARACVRWARN
jgi:aspartate racemase